jgi:nucleoside-diphosphate-sugar epimerase
MIDAAPPSEDRSRDASCRVLVSGAAGFIGSHLVENLATRGHEVTALVRYNARQDIGHLAAIEPALLARVRIVFGDVCDPEQMIALTAGHHVVLNLAALIGIPYSYQAPRSYLRTNVEGALNLLEASRRADIRRFVQVSTSEVYGTARTARIEETHPLQAQSPYAASKIAAEALCEAWRRNFNLPVVTVRPFNTFGPRQSERAVIPAIIAQAVRGGPVRLGSLTPVRDFTYVTDTAEALARAALHPGLELGPYNFGVGHGLSIGEAAQRIFSALGRSVPIELDPQRLRPPDGEVDRLISDNSLWRRATGWKPLIGFDEGLVRTIAALKADPTIANPALGGYVV